MVDYLVEIDKAKAKIFKHIKNLQSVVISVAIGVIIVAILLSINLIGAIHGFLTPGLIILYVVGIILLIFLAIGLGIMIWLLPSIRGYIGETLYKEYILRGEKFMEIGDFILAEKYLKSGLKGAIREKNDEWKKKAQEALDKINQK